MPSMKTNHLNVNSKSPEKPGRINKNLLTPCRQVGLSRKRKTPGLLQRSPRATSPVVGNSNNSPIINTTNITPEAALTSDSKKLLAPKGNSVIAQSDIKLQKSKATKSTKDTTDRSLEHSNEKIETYKRIKKNCTSKQLESVSKPFEASEANKDPSNNSINKLKPEGVVKANKRPSSKRQIINKEKTFETSNSSDESYSPLKELSNHLETSQSSSKNKKSRRVLRRCKIIDSSDSGEDSDWQPQIVSSKLKANKNKCSKEPNSLVNLANVSVKIARLDKCNKNASLVHNKSSSISPHPSCSSAINTTIPEEKYTETNTKELPKPCKSSTIVENISENNKNVSEVRSNISNPSPYKKKSTPGKSKHIRKSLSMKKTYSDDSIEIDNNVNTECSIYNTERNKTNEELDCFHINNIISQNQTCKIDSINILDHSDDFTSTPEEDKLSKDKLVQQINQLEDCIKTKKGRLSHLKQTKVYQKLHNADDLKKLFITWKKGCIQALNDLLPQLASHTQIDMPTLLKNLRIPPEFISISPQQQLN